MCEEVAQLVSSVFGCAGELVQIGGYYDRNFKLTLGPHQQYLIKLSVPGIYPHPLLPLQNQVIVQLEQAKLGEHVEPYTIVRTKEGELMKKVVFEQQERYLRAFRWIEGDTLNNYDTLEDEVFVEVGRVMANLSIALQKIGQQQPIAEYIQEVVKIEPEQQLIDPMNLPYVYETRNKYLPAQVKQLLSSILEHDFRANLKEIQSCPKQLVHHDANRQNIMLRHIEGKLRVNAIIDYEEIKYSPRIAQMATCCARNKIDPKDPLKNILLMLKGYSQLREVTQTQRKCFFPLLKARLAVLVLDSSQMLEKKKEESNIDYLTDCFNGQVDNIELMVSSATNEQFQQKIASILASDKQ